MDCHDVTAYVLSMDNGAELPPDVRLHLRDCPTCRADTARLQNAVETLQIGTGDSDVETLADGTIAVSALTERVMQAVRQEAEQQPAPLRNWIIAGTVLLGGLLGLRFSDVMNWLRVSFGPALDVAMSVILGLFLTAYICMLVASNLARVRRVFRLR